MDTSARCFLTRRSQRFAIVATGKYHNDASLATIDNRGACLFSGRTKLYPGRIGIIQVGGRLFRESHIGKRIYVNIRDDPIKRTLGARDVPGQSRH